MTRLPESGDAIVSSFYGSFDGDQQRLPPPSFKVRQREGEGDDDDDTLLHGDNDLSTKREREWRVEGWGREGDGGRRGWMEREGGRQGRREGEGERERELELKLRLENFILQGL